MSWSEVALCELAQIEAGGSAPQEAEAFSDQGLPFFRAGSLPKLLAGADESTLERILPDIARSYRLREFPAGTLLFAKSGMSATKGHIYRMKQPGYVVNHLAALIPSSDDTGRFLAHALAYRSPTALIQDAAYPSIRLGDVAKFAVPAPTQVSEQRRIAAILDKADSLRQKRKRAIALLDSLTQSIFLEMFGDAFGAINHGHEVQPLRALTSRITYGFTQPMSHHDAGIPILTGKNIKWGSIDYEKLHFTSQEDFDSLTDKSRPKRGDILVTKDGTIGRAAIFQSESPVCINQSVCLVQVDRSKVEAEYLLHYILSDSVQRRIDAMKKGNSIPHLQITEFAQFPVPLAPREYQLEFLKKIERQVKVRTELEAAYLNYQKLFVSLQHRAFSGQL